MDTDRLMQDALVLAGQAVALSEPNPRVGCVIVAPDGRVIGRGHTQQAGGPHAEVMALRDAAAHGRSVAGATAYVTLEPCAERSAGGTSCAQRLAEAGVARVVIACADPSKFASGRGAQILEEAGVLVEIGILEGEARSLYSTYRPHLPERRD